MSQQPLIDEVTLPAYAGMTDQEVADALNLPGDAVGPFGIYQIVNYFVLTGNKPASKEAAQILQLHTGLEIDYNDPTHVALVTAAMNALIDDSLATEADKTAILALGDGRDTRSRAEVIGYRYRPVKAHQVNVARAAQ